MSVARMLLDLAVPPACASCGVEGTVLCPICARPLSTRLDLPPGTMLGLAAPLPPPIAQIEWCAPFSGTVRQALHQLKYAGERRLAEPLGAALGARWLRAGAGGDLLVSVPIHAERARLRGYDQAELLAREASRRLAIPYFPALVRTRATMPQFDLGRRSRLSNVTGAFAVTARHRNAIAGRWVIVVDDVTTTGATLAACAEALLDAGALAVSALTVARER